MTLTEVLWPILAWRSSTIVGCRDSESGGTLTCDREDERMEEFDWKRIATFGHTQHIFD